MIVKKLTRKDLEDRGYDKRTIEKLVKQGRLKAGYGRIPETGQIVRAYEWSR